MEISTSAGTVTITGNIKTISDFQDIKSTLDTLVSSHKTIIINLVDSISLTSSVIGYFNKLILKDNINMRLNIGNNNLMELIKDLNLVSTLNAKKI